MSESATVVVDTSTVFDLSFPVDPDHFRWSGKRVTTETLAGGAAFNTTWFGQSAHAFTHADAPRHVDDGGPALLDVPPSTWTGSAAVIDVSGCEAQRPIGAEQLDGGISDVPTGQILLIRTDWDLRRDIGDPRYWEDAPWLEREAVEWLKAFSPRAVGFDFPQDRAIRLAIQGGAPSAEEFTTHDLLLRNGIGLIEYLCGLAALPPRVLLVAAPIALGASDGGPVRAIAFPLIDRPAANTAAERQT